MTIYNLFQTGASCILYGLLVTATLMAIMYFFLKEYNKNIVRTIPFFITGVVLAVLLTIQSSLLIGAVKAKGMIDSAEIYITQLTENEYGTISTNESQWVLDKVGEEFPIIRTYCGICDFGGNDYSQLPERMAETMRSYLSSFIWHRVWWMLGMIVVALFVVLIVPGTGKGSGKSLSSNPDDCFGSSGSSGTDWGF